MAELKFPHGPRQHLTALRDHVCEPVCTAIELAEREQHEVALERDAFERFADRARAIPVDSTLESGLTAIPVTDDSGSNSISALRRAYSKTVTDLDHYEEEYDESITENATAEFGPEIATLFDPASHTAFTERHRRCLVSAALQSAADREEFCETLGAELESLQSVRERLLAVLNELDSSVVPGWYRQQFQERLLEIITARQSAIEDRSPTHLDGHNLCQYLYGTEPQTYPALRAVARLLDSVTVRE